MPKITTFENRTSDDWKNKIFDLKEKVKDAKYRTSDIERGCCRLQLMAQDGSVQAQNDYERKSADLTAAIADRDGLRSSLVAAKELLEETLQSEATAVEQEKRQRITLLANCRAEQAKQAQKHIDNLAKVFSEMHETGVEIDRVSRTPDLRRHYVGDGFSARVNNAIGPALKQFNILSHLDSSHPKFGLAMTCSEGTADEAIAMLDRSNSEAVKEKARIDATKERIYG